MKILFFTRGLPERAELEEAAKAGALLRDCLAWHEGDFTEDCDLVMGKPENIPKPYRVFWKGTDKGAKTRKAKNGADS